MNSRRQPSQLAIGYNHRMYLVDGNNVIGQRVGWHRNKRAAQELLLRQLRKLGLQRDETVTVVFDGPPLEHDVEAGDLIDGVRVYFARRGSDADERIVELVRDSPERSDWVVVTSDRELGHRLRSLGVETVRSGQFRKTLDDLWKRGGD